MKYKAFHKLSYGLYIIASEHQGEKSGYIGNTAFQVTSDPPQLAISCNKDNYTVNIIKKSRVFSLSVLNQDLDTSIIGNFGFMSTEDTDKFENVDFKKFDTGAPVVTDASTAWFECKVVNEIDVGTHILFIGEVVNAEVLSDEPALTYKYYREKYKMLSPKNAPTYIEKEKLEAEGAAPEQVAGQESKPEEGKEKEAQGSKDSKMRSYTCSICGHIYNPEEGDPSAGIPPGTPFEDVPDDYKCPICNADKEYFQ